MNLIPARVGAVAAAAGGLCSVVIGISNALNPDGTTVATLAYLGRGLLLALAMLGIAALCRPRAAGLATTGAGLGVIGSLVQVTVLAMGLAGSDFYEAVTAPLSLLAIVVGLLLLGIACLRARALPVWASIGVLVGVLLTPVPGYGEMAFGLLYVAIGWAITRRPAPAPAPALG